MKATTIIGARPQFIKSAPVSRALNEKGIGEILIHTGQHYDRNMSDIFFREMGMKAPDVTLETGSGSHAEQTAAMLLPLEKCLQKDKPDIVIVYGDTNSTLAGALAAAKLNIPIAHVEAGLRSRNRAMPEEINRLVADRLTTILFAPTTGAAENLRNEGYPEQSISQVGDVMLDALRMFSPVADRHSRVLEQHGLESKRYAVATIHRAENTDSTDVLRRIFAALQSVAQQLPVVWPLHPRTRNAIASLDLEPAGDLRVIEPLGFLDMLSLVKGAAVVATDSGGLQKEAFWHSVPCVTLRTETEWVELLDASVNVLCPPDDVAKMAAAIFESIGKNIPAIDFYGCGDAAQKIAVELLLRSADKGTHP